MTTHVPLQAGDCRVTLTKRQREVLHLLLAKVREDPRWLLGQLWGTSDGRLAMKSVWEIQEKLPERFSGTYE